MELLIGAVVMVLTEAYKQLVARFGKEITTTTIYIVVFILACIWQALVSTNLISQETLVEVVKVFTAAVATYEVVVKWILKNILQ